MNKRIKALAEQALDTKRDGPTIWQFYDDQLKNFAELIVRECADICINKNVSILDINVIRESGKFTLQDLATKSCGENLSKQIKKHFGVEE